MPQVLRFLLIVGALALLAPTVTEAHFKLVEPAPWIVENSAAIPRRPARAAAPTTSGAPRATSSPRSWAAR